MPRTKGSANKETVARKARLLDAVWKAMRAGGGKPLSWREMAGAAAVGPATLAHHFGKRDAVVAAVLETRFAEGTGPLHRLATPSSDDVGRCLADALDHMLDGLLDFDVGGVVSVGLAESLHHDTLGPLFVEGGLEPILRALARRLEAHVEAGTLSGGIDTRATALMLAAPVILAYMHQHPLGGADAHPTDLRGLAGTVARTVAAGLAVPDA